MSGGPCRQSRFDDRGAQRPVVETHGLRDDPLRVGGDANPAAQTATVRFDPSVTSVEGLRAWVEECGYHCAGRSAPGHLCDPLVDDQHDHAARHADAAVRADQAHGEGRGGHAGMSMVAMERDMRSRFLVALGCAIPIAVWLPMGKSIFGSIPPTPFGIRTEVWSLVLSLPVIFYSSVIFFRGAWHAPRARTLDMMVLVAVAIGTGFVYSVAATFWIRGDVFYEAAAFLASFVLLGHRFEMRARGGANEAIRALLDLAPPKALVLRDGEPVEVATADLVVGDVLLIRPGAKVAVDAEVIEGSSSVDEAMITGESLPVSKDPGDRLIGATINKQGTLRARAVAVAVGSDTALAQIVKLVQEAQSSKAPAQRLADRAAFWLVLVALIGGLATFLFWYLVVGWSAVSALLPAITVVVITCPDALGLATPTAIMVGTGLGARRGILIKNALAIEQAARIDTVVLDKTGTLTRGEPRVVTVRTADGIDETTLLRLAASVERESEHPLAEAIVAAATERGIQALQPSSSRPSPAMARSPPSKAMPSRSATRACSSVSRFPSTGSPQMPRPLQSRDAPSSRSRSTGTPLAWWRLPTSPDRPPGMRWPRSRSSGSAPSC